MLFKGLAVAALAGTVLAQEPATPDLATLLANQTELSNLTSYLNLFPDFTSQLASLENITLFAPSNEAFAAFLNSSAGAALASGDTELITSVFSYHAVNGTFDNITDVGFLPTLLQPGQYANVTGGQVITVFGDENDAITLVTGLLSTANVTGEPLNFTGGVVHIIDSVLVIPQNVTETATQLNLTAAAGAIETLELAEAVDTLQDVTIFVPNNEAFAAIGSAIANLTTEELTAILTYHVISGTVAYSNLLENGTQVSTLQGDNVTITIDDDSVFVNSARVVIPDVLVANGVVHVIDNVLNPANATATATSGSESGSPAFEGASSASDVPFTSGARQPTGSVAATSVAPQATSSSAGAAVPMQTGAMGAAALFGGAALALNW